MLRTIQYWRVVAADGAELPGPFPSAQAVALLEAAEREGINRHLECHNGMTLLGHGAGVRPQPMIVLDKVRRANFPSVGDSTGARRPLPLDDGDSLLEPTYCAFLPNNVVAVLLSGDGPRPQRLAEYLRKTMDANVSLVPVLRRDLDAVLQEMRITEVQVAVPANRIDRELVGGDWASALQGAQALSHDGIVRVGLSVGKKGDRAFKAKVGDHYRTLVNELRKAAGFTDFKSAKAIGVYRGNRQVIDLIEDHFVERVEVDAEVLGNPDQSLAYAKRLLAEQIEASREYMESINPAVGDGTVKLAEALEARPDNT